MLFVTAGKLIKIYSVALPDLLSWARYRIYRDHRTWQHRTSRTEANWEPLLPELTDHYLSWKYPTSPPDDIPIQDPEDLNTVTFEIELVDIHTVPQKITIQRAPGSLSPCCDLACHGYIRNAPNNPTIAVSIKTLELYRRLRRRKPRFSIEAFAKVVCDIYMVCGLISWWTIYSY